MQKKAPLKLKFRTSMLWNSLESVMAQALITAHHILLQVHSGTELHGLFASSISIIYTFIPILNLGFDYSLAPYLPNFIQTKKNFLSLLLFQFLPQLLLICFLATLISQPMFYGMFFSIPFSSDIIFWLKMIFIIEYIRKSTRSLLQLMLYTKATASIEILGTIFYMSTFWILAYFFNIKPTLLMSFKLLALSALIQTLILFIHLLKILLSLNSLTNQVTDRCLSVAHQGLIKNRMGIWTNHIVSQINYSNFIVPFSSACFGPAQASALAILMNTARCVKLFFQKGLGVSTLALFSQPEDQQKTSRETKYTDPIYYLYNFAAPLSIFFLLNSSKLSHLLSGNQIVWHLAPLACFLSLIEGALSVYEKFYIAEKRIYLFSTINSIGSIILFILAYKFLIFNSLFQFFLFFFLIRTIALISIAILSHYFFKLSPFPAFNAYILAGATIFSVIVHLLF